MVSDEDKAGQQRTPEEQEVIRLLARAIWRSELRPGMTPEERKAGWVEARKDYLIRARKLERALGKESLSLARVAE